MWLLMLVDLWINILVKISFTMYMLPLYKVYAQNMHAEANFGGMLWLLFSPSHPTTNPIVHDCIGSVFVDWAAAPMY